MRRHITEDSDNTRNDILLLSFLDSVSSIVDSKGFIFAISNLPLHSFAHIVDQMSRWSLLKSSLVEKKRDCNSSSSIHRFNGYNLLQKRKIPWRGFTIEFIDEDTTITSEYILSECESFMRKVDAVECLVRINALREEIMAQLLRNPLVRTDSCTTSVVLLYIKRAESHTVCLHRCDYWYYAVNWANCAEPLAIYTREKPRDGGLSVRGLLSNKLHGVDNTGNVCVWPAEPLLLHTLLNVSRFTELVRSKRVLEIGGGMSALAGLGLAAAGLCESIVVTDGHPDCVINQAVCIEMCKQQARAHDPSCGASQGLLPGCAACDESDGVNQRMNICAQQLHWSPSVNAEQVASLTAQGSRLFDAVIASDCLFFKDFHADLVATLRQLLVPGGVGIFLQPCRDRTLQRFVEKCAEADAFSVEILEHYSPQVSELREKYLEKQDELGYAEDIHYPIMLILTKK